MRAPSSFRILALALLALLSGCGLVFDYQPQPDGGSGFDAGARRDGGVEDAGARDGGARDARVGPEDAGPVDGGIVHTCDGAREGAFCGTDPPFVCVGGQCMPSRCGDEVIDPRRGEACDDGNDVSGDGCEPVSCTFACLLASDCAPIECHLAACASGTCAYMVVPPGSLCGGAIGGQCTEGRCVSPQCGDDVDNAGEECDDGNSVAGDGCEPDCTFTCETSPDCDEVACDGVRTCVSNICVDTGVTEPCPLRPCERPSCSLTGCAYAPLDADEDGHGPLTDPLFSGAVCGDDCVDTESGIFPGAPDVVNDRDDDCDGLEDEVEVDCLPDLDGDTYGGAGPTTPRVMCRPGEAARPGDCFDANVNLDAPIVNPAQGGFFDRPWCAGAGCSYDWDCNGIEQRESEAHALRCNEVLSLMECREGSGWVGGPPACGAPGTWRTCSGIDLGGLLGVACTATDRGQVQRCR